MKTSIRSSSGLTIAGLVLAGLLCAAPITARAQQVVFLPGYSITQSAGASASYGGNGSVTTNALGPWSNSATSPAGAPFGVGTGSASGSAAGTPSPLISANLFASLTPGSVVPGFESNYDNSAAYTATLIYSFEVLGPTPTALVQINSLAQYASGAATTSTRFDAFLETSVEQMDSTGGAVARVLTDISTLNTFNNNVVATPDGTGSLATGFHGGFNENGVYLLQTYTRYDVDLQFSIDMHINGFGGSDTFSGSIDPTFAIAPGAPNAGAYTFLFSNGIGNSPFTPGGVPEPATWAMMLAGLGAMGAALRASGRRTRATAPAR